MFNEEEKENILKLLQSRIESNVELAKTLINSIEDETKRKEFASEIVIDYMCRLPWRITETIPGEVCIITNIPQDFIHITNESFTHLILAVDKNIDFIERIRRVSVFNIMNLYDYLVNY